MNFSFRLFDDHDVLWVPAFCAAIGCLAGLSAMPGAAASLLLDDTLCIADCAPVKRAPDDRAPDDPEAESLILPPRQVEDSGFLGDFMPAGPAPRAPGLFGGAGDDRPPPARR